MKDSQSNKIDTIQLGKSDVWIPLMGTGCWQWGERKFWEYGSTYQKDDVYEAYRGSIEAGILFFDTSEGYGQGESERLLGEITLQNHQIVIVATKYDPKPWRRWKRSVIYAGQQSLKRLRLQKVDLYQIHWPSPPLSIEKMAEALAELVALGRTRAVGVSNYNEEQMYRTYETLSKHGIPLASNQVRYSLCHREVERNGIMKACKELGVTLIAYSPIAQGLLTGKYSPERLPTGRRRNYYGVDLLTELQPLITVLKEVGQSNGGKTPAQVALNWLLCKGAVPIPGAKNGSQVKENAGALGWRLSAHDMEVLDSISSKY
jgi:aryl-alcohol dehydrogenase-like predicted oxidoreductase